MAIDEFTTNPPAGADPNTSTDSLAPAPFKPHELTVHSRGPDNMPSLLAKGRWLGQAGFPVGTRVRIDVSTRRLVVEAIEPKQPSRCADPDCPHQRKRRR